MRRRTEKRKYFTFRPPPDDPNARKIVYPAGSLVQDFRGWKVALDSRESSTGEDLLDALSQIATVASLEVG